MSPFRMLDNIKNSAEMTNRTHPQRSYLLTFGGLLSGT